MSSDLQAPSASIPAGFIALFVIVGLVSIGFSIWRFSVLRSGGLNPFVAKEQLEAKLAQSQMMAPASQDKTVEERLAEVDDLFNRGVISADEHASARAKIISGD